MSKRPEDLTDEQLDQLLEELDKKVEGLSDQIGSMPHSGYAEEVLEAYTLARRESSRRCAHARRKAGGYSATLLEDGQPVEYELVATTPEEARAEAEAGASSMANVTGMTVTVERINGPLTDQ